MRKAPPPVGTCSGCSHVRPLRYAQQTLCQSCYQRAYKVRSRAQAAAAWADAPPLPRCRCGRAAHPVFGTCYRCGAGWPQLAHVTPSDSAPVFPGRMVQP